MSTINCLPNGAGDLTQLTKGGTTPAATNWESVDDPVASPDDGTTTVLGTVGAAKEDLYTINTASLPDNIIINSITVKVRCLAGIYAEGPTVSCCVKTGGVNTVGTGQAISTSAWSNYQQQWTVNPNGGGWSRSAIVALQIGVQLSTGAKMPPNNNCACTQVYVTVDYSPDTNFLHLF